MKKILALVSIAMTATSYGAVIGHSIGGPPGAGLALGINPAGHLNVPDVYGLSSGDPTGVTLIGLGDATSPGCLCEGWGVSTDSFGGHSGFANIDTDFGVNNLTVDSFLTDDVGGGPGTFATSSVSVSSLPGLKVTQHYTGSGSTAALFENTVTISNDTGATISDVRYVRVMDWDVPPTPFEEFVTIKGTGTTTELERSHNNGFNTADPLGGDVSLDAVTEDVDFEDYYSVAFDGDHGAYFRFNFGDLDPGESKEFTIFYGAADTEDDAETALGAVGAELFSLGQSSTPDGPTDGTPGTFIFGFKGVGGVVVIPTPDGGASVALLGLSLFGLCVGKRFQRKKL